jgi:uncharacterized protein (TIGR00725 family)
MPAGDRPGAGGARLVIGVMGSAAGPFPEPVCRATRRLGRAVAAHGCCLITGACPGLPHEAVIGAKEAGGLVVGISPALARQEHIDRYGSPVDGYDVLIYTGSGLMGREVVAIRSSDAVVVIGGHSGTLGEFAIAYDEGRLIGLLKGSGGIADAVPDLLAHIDKDTGAVVIADDDPDALVARLLAEYQNHHFRRPSVFADGRI